MNRKRVVISAINFTEGGPLTVLRECLFSAAIKLPANCELIAIVNAKNLIQHPRIRLIAISSAKKSWIRRIYWEWFGFRKISRKLKPILWLSLHDVTPRVEALRQAVYCHNPSPFYRISAWEAFLEPSFLIFNTLYIYLYKIFIHRNYCVIVQQDWIRERFKAFIPLTPVVVAYPIQANQTISNKPDINQKLIFLYPALPRVFKNMEILCEASRLLLDRGYSNFEVRLTIDGSENRYARWLYSRYAHLTPVIFIGRQSREAMSALYQNASAVVFPSKLETWGLPISEAKAYSLPLLIADLPYAKETVGNYDQVSFFPPESPQILADLMQSLIEKKWVPFGNAISDPSAPFASSWHQLWETLIAGLDLTTEVNDSGCR